MRAEFIAVGTQQAVPSLVAPYCKSMEIININLHQYATCANICI